MIFLWGWVIGSPWLTHLCWLPKTTISHFFPPGYQLKGDVRWTAMDPAPALLKKHTVIWRVPERYTVDGWNKRDGFKFSNVFCFCFHKTFSQNFWTISGWIGVKLVPKFHLAIPRDSCWRVVTTSLPKWVVKWFVFGWFRPDEHSPSPSITQIDEEWKHTQTFTLRHLFRSWLTPLSCMVHATLYGRIWIHRAMTAMIKASFLRYHTTWRNPYFWYSGRIFICQRSRHSLYN